MLLEFVNTKQPVLQPHDYPGEFVLGLQAGDIRPIVGIYLPHRIVCVEGLYNRTLVAIQASALLVLEILVPGDEETVSGLFRVHLVPKPWSLVVLRRTDEPLDSAAATAAREGELVPCDMLLHVPLTDCGFPTEPIRVEGPPLLQRPRVRRPPSCQGRSYSMREPSSMSSRKAPH